MDLLSAELITVQYRDQPEPALRNVSVKIRAAEIVGEIGPNGSGKSTLVRVLSRVEPPLNGLVRLKGRDLYREVKPLEAALAIAVAAQENAIPFDFTVREVTEMARAPHLPRRPFAGMSAQDRQIADDALHMCGLSAFADRSINALSGGERQRAFLARAIAQETEILLLDEPTSHMDLRYQSETLRLAASLAHEQGKAVMVVLHDLNLAAAWCDRLVLLQRGHIRADGPIEHALSPELLEEVYEVTLLLHRHPETGRPLIFTGGA